MYAYLDACTYVHMYGMQTHAYIYTMQAFTCAQYIYNIYIYVFYYVCMYVYMKVCKIALIRLRHIFCGNRF